jgi:hypothetical protein
MPVHGVLAGAHSCKLALVFMLKNLRDKKGTENYLVVATVVEAVYRVYFEGISLPVHLFRSYHFFPSSPKLRRKGWFAVSRSHSLAYEQGRKHSGADFSESTPCEQNT